MVVPVPYVRSEGYEMKGDGAGDTVTANIITKESDTGDGWFDC